MPYEHLLILPDRGDAEELAEQLTEAGHLEVRVMREALAGEDDSEDHEWAVHVVTETDVSDEMFSLATAYDGWYDTP